MAETIWVSAPLGEEASTLAAELGIQPEIARILVNRGIRTPEAAQYFLYGDLDCLHNPYLMAGMREAVDRIRQAISNKERILIFGDYDVDGVLSVVVLSKALSFLGAEVDFFIPERLKEGYGIKESHIEVALERKSRLVISADCGIKATQFAKRAKEKGIDLIITDHHLPGDSLPEALAILNPVLDDSGYPDKNLAAIGVAFKLIQALFEKEGKLSSLPHYLKLVAIGTIADVSALRGENRLFVKFGLRALENVSNTGLMSLIELCGLEGRKVSVGDVGFRIGPRINAAGRMGVADLAVLLFFSESRLESLSLAQRLDELNAERQKTQDRIFNQALEIIQSRSLDKRYRFLVLGCEDWHRGVIGIVASKLKDFFYRPVLLFSYENGQAHGSGRSISEFALINCLDGCKDLFLDYGGHAMAVGCTLLRENVSLFKRAVNAYASSFLSEEDLKRKIGIDSRINFSDLDSSFISNYSLLSPFGVGNPTPVFLTEGAEVISEPQRIKDKHCRLLLRQKERVFEAFGWEKGDWLTKVRRGDTIDLAYSLQFSEYRGEETINLCLEDIKK